MNRSWLYHHTEEARIFEGDELLAAQLSGWVDDPSKVALPAPVPLSDEDAQAEPEPEPKRRVKR